MPLSNRREGAVSRIIRKPEDLPESEDVIQGNGYIHCHDEKMGILMPDRYEDFLFFTDEILTYPGKISKI